MKGFLKKIVQKPVRIVAFVMLLLILCGSVLLAIPGKEAVAEDKYPIMGYSNVSIGQLMNYYNSQASYPGYYAWVGSDAPTLDAFCQIYIEECAAEGVRVEVAFCQAMKETGYLRFGGAVDIGAYNFAGIGAVDSNPGSYNWFSSVREGVRAQVQHLKAYASTSGLNNACVDPRFNLVTRGCAPYVEDLGGRWASGANYGYSIRNEYMAKLGTFNGFTTMYQGVDYSKIYDPSYYLEHNPDLRAAYANDGYALISHFVNYGMSEGRQACSWFNVYVYKNNYVDLRNAYGYDIRRYYLHYLNAGDKEGRQGWLPNGSTAKVTCLNGVDYSRIYDYDYYTTANPDIKARYGSDDIGALYHFVNYGMNEGRQASANFSYASYRNQYPDLRAAYFDNKKSYYLHYLFYGYKEGRAGTGCNSLVGAITSLSGTDYSNVYDYNYYKEHSPDVYRAYNGDDTRMLLHFVFFGRGEGRQGKENFNVTGYKNRYLDLRRAYGDNLYAYYDHYMKYGIYEGRDGSYTPNVVTGEFCFLGFDMSAVYDFNYYQQHNPDIRAAYGNDDIRSLCHFVSYGIWEGRRASSNFDLWTYISRNPDLRAAYGWNLPAYVVHYIIAGRYEGRSAI